MCKWQLGGRKRLACEMHHDARILPDRIKHDGVAKLGRNLAHDSDCLGLQTLQMLGLHADNGRTCGSDGHGTFFSG